MQMTNAQETLHEISWSMGFRWAALPQHVRYRLCDSAGGACGLAQLAVDWADEFEELYTFSASSDQAHLNGVEVDSYIDALEGYFEERWQGFVAGAVARRLIG